MLLSVIGFLVILGPLVVFHEFGHYIFARIFNVKAEAFSIGFGPRLWKKQLGETELRVSCHSTGRLCETSWRRSRERTLSRGNETRASQASALEKIFHFFRRPAFQFYLSDFCFHDDSRDRRTTNR